MSSNQYARKLSNPAYSIMIILLLGIILVNIPITFSQIANNVTIPSSGKIMTLLPIHVEGSQIKKSNGELVFLNGINKHGFENFPEGSWQAADGAIDYGVFNPEVVSANLDAMKRWGINLVRCYSTSEFWIENTAGHREIVKQLAMLCAEREMYLVYSFWHNTQNEDVVHVPYPSVTFPTSADFVGMWRDIGSELKDYPNILFSIWNEPLGNDTRMWEWFDVSQQCITAIRSTGAENLIVVQWDGIWYNSQGPFPPVDEKSDWGNTMWWVEGYDWNDPTGNLVYEFHLYRNQLHYTSDGTRVNSYSYEDISNGLYECLVDYMVANNKTLFCGEVGPVTWYTGEELAQEIEFYDSCLTRFNELGVHYAGFWWWPSGPYAHLSGSNYQPNAGADVLINAIAEGPN